MIFAALALAASIAPKQKLNSIQLDSHGFILSRYTANIDELNSTLGYAGSKSDFRFLFHAAIYQSSFRPIESSQQLAMCESRTNGPLSSVKSIVLAVQCSNVRATPLFLKGDYAGWATFMEKAKERFQPALWAAIPKLNKVPIASLSPFDFRKFETWPRSRVTASSKRDMFVAKVNWKRYHSKDGRESQGRVPFVDVKIDGQPASALIDTESSSTYIPFRLADHFHVIPVARIREGVQGFDSGKTHWAAVGRVKSLSVAGVTISNAYVVVVHYPRVVLGLQQLQRLKHIRLSRNELSVLRGRNEDGLNCRKFSLGFVPWGAPSMIRLPVVVNGSAGSAILDTGQGDSFTRVVRDLGEGAGAVKSVTAFGYGNAEKEQAKTISVDVSLVGRNFHLPGLLLREPVNPLVQTLGAQVVHDAGFIDIDFQTGSACLPKN